MASYNTYPNNVPPTNPPQAAYPTYGAYPNPPDNQWSQPNAYGQAGPAFDQQNAYASPPAPPSYNQAAPGDYGNLAPSYGGGDYNQMKKNDYGPKGGNPNFRVAVTTAGKLSKERDGDVSRGRGNNPGNKYGNSGPGFNKGPRGNNFSLPSGIEEQQDTIFVSGLTEGTTEDELKDYFGSIGLIKIDKKTRKPKIWVYKDKETGKPKGEVTITYDDPPTASSAISWFNGKPFNGSVLKVELAQRKNSYLAGGPPGAGGGGGGGGGRPNFNRNRDFDRDRKGGNDRNSGGSAREGDWVCDDCQNNNFAWRDSCNRCKAEKPASAGGGASGGGGGDRRNNNLPYERRGGGPMNGSRGDRGSFGGGPRFNRGGGGGPQDRSFGGRGGDQRGPRNNNGGGGAMRGNSDNRRANPY